jgi:hypothetical protein
MTALYYDVLCDYVVWTKHWNVHVLYVCMYACMHACMYVCMYVWMDVCMHACMYVCMHVCMQVLDDDTRKVPKCIRVVFIAWTKVHILVHIVGILYSWRQTVWYMVYAILKLWPLF